MICIYKENNIFQEISSILLPCAGSPQNLPFAFIMREWKFNCTSAFEKAQKVSKNRKKESDWGENGQRETELWMRTGAFYLRNRKGTNNQNNKTAQYGTVKSFLWQYRQNLINQLIIFFSSNYEKHNKISHKLLILRPSFSLQQESAPSRVQSPCIIGGVLFFRFCCLRRVNFYLRRFTHQVKLNLKILKSKFNYFQADGLKFK